MGNQGEVPTRVFPGSSDSKVSTYSAGDLGSIPGSGRSPGEGNGKPFSRKWPGESHGWSSLVDYSPWGHKESDMTEQPHFHFPLLVIFCISKMYSFIILYNKHV